MTTGGAARTDGLELVLGPDRTLLAADLPFLRLLGWAGEPPTDASRLLESAPEALRAPLDASFRGGLPAANPPFLAEACWTSLGPGRRIRVADGIVLESLELWSADLPHQLRNQQMVLANALFALAGNGPAPGSAPPLAGSPGAPSRCAPESEAECLRLGEAALRRTLALVEAFEGLALPGRGEEHGDAGLFLERLELLIAARVRRRESVLAIGRERVQGVAIDPIRSARIAAGLLSRVLPGLDRGRRLAIDGAPAAEGVRLEIRLTGLPAAQRALLDRELEAWFALADRPVGGRLAQEPPGWWALLPRSGTKSGCA